MFSKLQKSIGLSIVAGLAPVMLVISPVAAATLPAKIPAPVQAQAQPGSSVSLARAPMAGWVQIPANTTQWFKFSYHYDNSTKGNTPSQAMVKLTMDTPGAVNFALWTPGSLQNPVHNVKDTKSSKSLGRVADHTNDVTQPIGYGTVMDLGAIRNVIGYHDTTNNSSTTNSDTNSVFQGQDKQTLLTDTSLLTDKKGNVLNSSVLTWVGGAQASDTYYVAVKNSSNAPVHYQLSISGPDVSFK